ncbi:tyrosine recombinase XerS [Bacillus sp. ISL-40]|uniref:tyrosine recombinase XerS n=1 Tax=unclassified Bacillus (in: firmicutes) TaxID=185979 RepID=UPI001BEB443D|nr:MULTISPECIES: tyrosine recombinase XerS [unclassified Bacillus (in: firmicutes)]MBT2700880.1 tyrosine recombinase XerS [Bacillus sp. ISL-40]MBT2740698.1 tyrosine recombinase XerS [Bacillus sp. ISL-77]
MAISKQHEYYENKLETLLKEMPNYVVEYVDAKQDIRSPITLFHYVRDYRDFFNWLISEGIANCKQMKDISPETLGNLSLEEARNYFKFVGRKKYKVSQSDDETKKIDPKTVNRHKSSLRSLFKYMTIEAELENKEPYFHRNVMQKIEVTKVSETFNERAKNLTDKIFIDNKDLDFLDYIKGDYVNSLSSIEKKYFERDKERNISILSLFLGTGIRVNELSNLRIKDIDFSSKEISVIRKGNKKDTISVTPSSLEDLQKYLSVRQAKYKAGDGENEFVYVKLFKNKIQPLTNRAIENIVYKFTKSFDKRMSPHKLRHTYATNLAEQTNGDIPLIMSQLGHTSSDISLLYINTSREKARRAAELLDKRRENKS